MLLTHELLPTYTDNTTFMHFHAYLLDAVVHMTVNTCRTDHQWQPKGESKLTGGASFQQRPMIASTTTWTTPQYQPPMVRLAFF